MDFRAVSILIPQQFSAISLEFELELESKRNKKGMVFSFTIPHSRNRQNAKGIAIYNSSTFGIDTALVYLLHILARNSNSNLTSDFVSAADPIQPGGQPDHVDGGLPGLGRRPPSRVRRRQGGHGGVRQDQGECRDNEPGVTENN